VTYPSLDAGRPSQASSERTLISRDSLVAGMGTASKGSCRHVMGCGLHSPLQWGPEFLFADGALGSATVGKPPLVDALKVLFVTGVLFPPQGFRVRQGHLLTVLEYEAYLRRPVRVEVAHH